ncbi:hypothetical protein AB0E59_35860 [Lentzea sp. NPDC034063]|uniref:hypothetical protein n=1 Tax=unclassified Lentzea TaxID=2643253 RepID=UPI0033D2645C
MVGIPPNLTGTYTRLKEGVSRLELAGVPVWVCDPTKVLDRMPDPPRSNGLARADAYAALWTRLEHDRTPQGIARLD